MINVTRPLLLGDQPYVSVHKFGENLDVDTTTLPEDVWTQGGEYPFPASAQATTIVSSDANDGPGGTGALTVGVEGINANWKAVSETVTMNGVTPVALKNQYLRVYRAYNKAVGSNGINVGTIDIKHSSTIISQIAIGEGQTLMAIYSTPGDGEYYLAGYRFRLGRDISANAGVKLQVRNFGEGWRTIESDVISDTNGINEPYAFMRRLQPKTDIRARVTSASTNNIKVYATFDIYTYYKSV